MLDGILEKYPFTQMPHPAQARENSPLRPHNEHDHNGEHSE
jgi:hypothetical protein